MEPFAAALASGVSAFAATLSIRGDAAGGNASVAPPDSSPAPEPEPPSVEDDFWADWTSCEG